MSEHPPILDQTLPNGLRVLLREDHAAPLVSSWVWYRVGSRNELPGLTGLSHWVEHMQFKGTPSLAKGQIFRDVSRHGGVLNALTSQDWTAYFETLPVEQVDLSLAIESDRMVNSLFDPAETESERTVILSERAGAENSPTYLLYEEVLGAAFRAHPYRHMVIGHEADLRSISRDDLYNHYRRYYHPGNAFLVAVGDFQAEELLGRVERAFGGIPAGEPAAAPRAVEPPQLGERRVTLRRPSPTAYLRMAFSVPEARHPDTAPLLVADAILSGAKGMGFGGGGPMGRSARLYRALVAAGLARAAGSDADLTLDPSLLVVGVTALPGVEPARIEEVVDREVARLRDEPVADAELARALKQVQAQYVYSAEGVTNQAFWLGQMEIVDHYRRADTFADELSIVTVEDVQRVARTYLVPERRTVGWLLPSGDGGGDATEPAAPAVLPDARYRRWWYSGTTIEPGTPAEDRERPPFERAELGNGIVVLGQAQPSDRAVFVRLRLQTGALGDLAGKDGLAAFTARMLPRGTERMGFDQLNETTDGLGASLSIDAGRLFVEVAIRCLREDLPQMLDLAADVLRRPTFPEEEIEKVRNELLTAIREGDNDTRSTADRTLRRLLFPPPHPYGRRVGGELETVAAINRDDLVAYHAGRYGPAATTVAIVGGLERFDQAVEWLDARLGDWSAAAAPLPLPPLPAPPASSRREEVVIPAKTQVDLAIGWPTLARTDPAYYAFDTANLILGRLGLMGRLGASVRDRQGLAYYVFSGLEAGLDGSLWTARAGVDPANAERAIASILAEAEALRERPVEPAELADAKSYLTGVLPLALESNDGVAATLLSIEYFGLGLDYLDRYPGLINRLTAEALQEAVRSRLDLDRAAVAIAGPPVGGEG